MSNSRKVGCPSRVCSEIAEALGLDVHATYEVSLRMAVGEVATVTASMYLDDGKAQQLTNVIRKYRLHSELVDEEVIGNPELEPEGQGK